MILDLFDRDLSLADCQGRNIPCGIVKCSICQTPFVGKLYKFLFLFKKDRSILQSEKMEVNGRMQTKHQKIEITEENKSKMRGFLLIYQ